MTGEKRLARGEKKANRKPASGGSVESRLAEHVTALRACTRCPLMHRPAVSGGPVVSKVISVGQAPGSKEPIMGRPFAWTAGKTLFRWFQEACGISEEEFRASVYMAAVARCFPGKTNAGGDRVPNPIEIATCGSWLRAEIDLLKPELIIPIGKLAILQFIPEAPLVDVIGKTFRVERFGHRFDLIPLPHPSGASPWHRIEPGKTLQQQAMRAIVEHPAWSYRPAIASGRAAIRTAGTPPPEAKLAAVRRTPRSR